MTSFEGEMEIDSDQQLRIDSFPLTESDLRDFIIKHGIPPDDASSYIEQGMFQPLSRFASGAKFTKATASSIAELDKRILDVFNERSDLESKQGDEVITKSLALQRLIDNYLSISRQYYLAKSSG